MNEYESTRRVVYGEGATFIPVCWTCGRFVKADPFICEQGETINDQDNAACSKCGRTRMLFEGYV